MKVNLSASYFAALGRVSCVTTSVSGSIRTTEPSLGATL